MPEPKTIAARPSERPSWTRLGLEAQSTPAGARALDHATIVRIFLPLSLSDVIMIMAGPILTVGLARLAAPETSLAAYSVAQNVAILLESPIIMLLHASTALTRYRELHRPLFRFMVLANVAVTLVYLALAFTPAYDFVFRALLGQPPAVADAARPCFQWMLLWPAAIGWRRFYQGVLINRRQSGRIALAGFARLGSLALVTFLGVVVRAPGAGLAGLALVVSVIAEATAVTLFAEPWQRPLARTAEAGAPRGGGAEASGRLDSEAAHEPPPTATAAGRLADEPPPPWVPRTVTQIALWYWPLAMTQVLVWAVRPFINGGIARTVSPEIGLAAWPVAWSTITMVANSVRAVQQLALSLLSNRTDARGGGRGSDRGDAGGRADDSGAMDCRAGGLDAAGEQRAARDYVLLRRFVWEVGLVASACLALLAFTPVGDVYLGWVLGLSGDLEPVARATLPALGLAVVYPLLMAWQNWFQGLIIQAGKPGWVNGAAMVGGAVTLAAVYAGALIWRLPGAPLGALALVVGLAAELAVLALVARRNRAGQV